MQILTDEGVVGLGETYGGESTARALEFAKSILAGSDPFEIERILKKLQVFCISYETFVPPHVVAAIDMA